MSIKGFVETVTSHQVQGWAYDSDQPSAHVEIVIRAGDIIVASGRADVLRQDLRAAGIGDGDHGFMLDLMPAIDIDTLFDIETMAQVDKARHVLPLVPSLRSTASDPVSNSNIPITDTSQFPVFILGPARSGTSSITLGLLESDRYKGYGEGHLLPLAHEMLSMVDRYYQRHAGDGSDTMLRNVPVQVFQSFVRRSFVQLARSIFPTAYWLDKTPTVEMVRAAPLMREIWPNARFIFMKRRVIENVLSRKRKFPLDSADSHYSDWVAVMQAWLEVRDALAGAYLEVDHRQLVLHPGATASGIAEFLDMPADAAARLRHYICTSRPEQTAAMFGSIHMIDDLGLTEAEMTGMLARCDPMMTAYGYVYGRDYYAGTKPKRRKPAPRAGS